jgi:small subunit ribosomal protein S15e
VSASLNGHSEKPSVHGKLGFYHDEPQSHLSRAVGAVFDAIMLMFLCRRRKNIDSAPKKFYFAMRYLLPGSFDFLTQLYVVSSFVCVHPLDDRALYSIIIMDADKVAELRKKRQFRKFTFRGIELEQLLDLTNDELMDLVCARARRRMSRGLKRKPMALIKRLRQAKKEAPQGEKPRGVKTHLRNMIIVPEMIGSIIGIYNGKMFCGVEMKPEMIGMYLGEFAITYKPVRHGRPGVSAAHQTRFIPL